MEITESYFKVIELFYPTRLTFKKPESKVEYKDEEDDKSVVDTCSEQSNGLNMEQDDNSEDPFEIYRTMEKMKINELINQILVGFHSWINHTKLLHSPTGDRPTVHNPLLNRMDVRKVETTGKPATVDADVSPLVDQVADEVVVASPSAGSPWVVKKLPLGNFGDSSIPDGATM
ncbi:hypothetical protein LXL04_007485 [Taraxacum kok-saghyz]